MKRQLEDRASTAYLDSQDDWLLYEVPGEYVALDLHPCLFRLSFPPDRLNVIPLSILASRTFLETQQDIFIRLDWTLAAFAN